MKVNNQNPRAFLVEIFEFTDKQLEAIDYQTQMTQTIYNSILNRCTELGSDANPLFFRMLREYSDLMTA